MAKHLRNGSMKTCKCGVIYSGSYHCCQACHDREIDEMQALRKRQQAEFEEAIRSHPSAARIPLLYEDRMTLIDLGQDCAYDGNGPANLDGCYRLIDFVELKIEH